MNFKIMFWGLFLLSGCGFQPLYTQKETLINQTAAVQINPIAGNGGYQMGLILKDKLNPDDIQVSKKYKLTVVLQQPKYANQSIRSDNFASLESMMLSADYQLTDLSNQKTLISSSVNSNGLFNLIKDPYATVVAQDKLYDNLIQLMGNDIAMHVLSYFKEEKP
ncbi:MAG: hypothetical protein IJV07_04350 [Alphaproteobacteria bacterium]|nr:hypothetical protein [Alphaproteobacteria bacterium]